MKSKSKNTNLIFDRCELVDKTTHEEAILQIQKLRAKVKGEIVVSRVADYKDKPRNKGKIAYYQYI